VPGWLHYRPCFLIATTNSRYASGFNDGTHGYQQLTPDRRLTNPRRYGLTCVTNPLTVYVNSSDGNDYDNGLTTDTAKRTVQAAVDMLPKSLHAKTIVKLAPGTYTKFSACGSPICRPNWNSRAI
jgi:hypothetical protein